MRDTKGQEEDLKTNRNVRSKHSKHNNCPARIEKERKEERRRVRKDKESYD